jgi:hypothetical protein
MTITHNLADFHAAVDVFVAKHGTGISLMQIQAKVAFDALAGLTLYSPVDTGYLRYNYQLTIGQPADGMKGEVGVEYEDQKAGNIDNAELVALGKLTPFQMVWITNNAEYAEAVNNGTDRAAAHLMLERTISDLTEKLIAG